MKKTKIFYGWYVVAACFFFELVMLGIANGTSSLYIKPICDNMGFSRGNYSFVFSIVSLAGMFAALTFGAVYKKLKNVRYVFLIGLLSLVVSYLVFYFAEKLYVFYIGAALMGLAITYSATIPLAIVISNWFVDKRGAVLGLVYAGSGIGGAILNPVIGYWIANFGWRKSYLFAMFFVMAICIPALLIIKGKPSDMGLKPYGWEIELNATSEDLTKTGITLKEAWKTKLFWIVLFSVLFYGMAVQPLYYNSSAHLGGVGFDPQTIAMIMSIVFIINTAAKVLLGNINDRYGIKKVLYINHGFFIISIVLLIFARSNAAAFAFAGAYGIGYTIISITLPLIVSCIFGQKDYASFMGVMMAAQYAGYSIGTPMGGFSYDILHSYSYAFWMQLILDIASLVLVFIAFKIKGKIV